MVGPGERSLAQLAFEGFLAGVFPVVAGEFVRPSESPSASFPGALVGFFSWGEGEKHCQKERNNVRRRGIMLENSKRDVSPSTPFPGALVGFFSWGEGEKHCQKERNNVRRRGIMLENSKRDISP